MRSSCFIAATAAAMLATAAAAAAGTVLPTEGKTGRFGAKMQASYESLSKTDKSATRSSSFRSSGKLNPLKDDPADSWMAYTMATAPDNSIVTYVNSTWTVPANPTNPNDASAPGFWFGVEPRPAAILIQPILAYGDFSNVYTIFNGYFDWNSGNWQQSDSIQVNPGDVIQASVTYNSDQNAYTMYIAKAGQTGISTTIPVQYSATYMDVYFVIEHQPNACDGNPANGQIVFEDINIAWNNTIAASPQWSAQQYQPACNSQAYVVDAKTSKFTWATQ